MLVYQHWQHNTAPSFKKYCALLVGIHQVTIISEQLSVLYLVPLVHDLHTLYVPQLTRWDLSLIKQDIRVKRVDYE